MGRKDCRTKNMTYWIQFYTLKKTTLMPRKKVLSNTSLSTFWEYVFKNVHNLPSFAIEISECIWTTFFSLVTLRGSNDFEWPHFIYYSMHLLAVNYFQTTKAACKMPLFCPQLGKNCQFFKLLVIKEGLVNRYSLWNYLSFC